MSGVLFVWLVNELVRQFGAVLTTEFALRSSQRISTVTW
jgi:hypothetical protein